MNPEEKESGVENLAQEIYTIPVDAVLYNEQEVLLEYGKAFIQQNGDFIDFKNEFIPMLKLGERVYLSMMLDGVEALRFFGTTYISSANFLRISIHEKNLLRQARELFGSNLCVHSILTFQEKGWFQNKKNQGSVAATIYRISRDTLRFLSLEPVQVGQRLLVHFTEPFSFENVLVEVEAMHRFGLMAVGYQCYILNMPDEAQDAVSHYLSPLRLEVARLRAYRCMSSEGRERDEEQTP